MEEILIQQIFAKAVYGTILGAILFYKKLSKQLEYWGFEKNHYNECTWNEMVDGKQLTVQAYVDNLVASHKDQCVLDNFIKELNEVFGKEKKLEETKCDVHEYPGLTIDFSMPGNVVFSMFNYLGDNNFDIVTFENASVLAYNYLREIFIFNHSWY